ncbi:uncharacterized protein LOC134788507 [Penaeus indicus]|uniref:uncharacterized protein LOC134788507 n=1 Tax=Penaeus indicus TaxID=29960 RepID=UPI00300C5D2A
MTFAHPSLPLSGQVPGPLLYSAPSPPRSPATGSPVLPPLVLQLLNFLALLLGPPHPASHSEPPQPSRPWLRECALGPVPRMPHSAPAPPLGQRPSHCPSALAYSFSTTSPPGFSHGPPSQPVRPPHCVPNQTDHSSRTAHAQL